MTLKVIRRTVAVLAVKRFRFSLMVLGLLGITPLFGQVMIHEYALRGSLSDNLGGPALTSLGGSITGAGYVFGQNQGLSLASPTTSTTSYSLELVLTFDAVSGYRKIADFNHLNSDAGFYDLNGQLNFYPSATGATVDFVAGAPVTIALTRDSASNLMVGYVNGVQRFSFTDSSLDGVFGGSPLLTLFVDDTTTGQRESSGGSLTSFRVFNSALSSSQVNALYLRGPAAVPEPSSATLLSAGALVLVGVKTWKRFRI